MILRFGAALLWTLAAATCAASADPVETSFAITINPLDGSHTVDHGLADAVHFAPLPLAELTERMRNESLRIEGLPPVTLRYGGAGDGAQSTALSILNLTYRHTFGGGWFAGAGQTIYNQSTTYGTSNGNYIYTRGTLVDYIFGHEVQYSRVTGPRFEGGNIVRHGRDQLEVWAAVNPRMHGVQYTQIPTYRYICASAYATAVPCFPTVATFSDPETAAQVDLSARFARRLSSHSELLLGLRYLNYTAHYVDFPGQIADRNVGWAPVLGYRLRL